MKSIAIVTRQMITGGVEKALIAMLKKFDYTKVSVDLYVMKTGGELFNDIPKSVNVIVIPTVTFSAAFSHPVSFTKKIKSHISLKTKKLSYIEQCYESRNMYLPIRKEYDFAVSYHAPNTMPVFYVIDKMKAKKKVLWLHGDLETNGGTTDIAIKYHSKYDKIFGVSQSVCDSFKCSHPDMSDKIEIFYNYVDVEEVKRLALTGPTYNDGFDGFRILTIGRLHNQKGLDMAIPVCAKLKEAGYNVRWYVCGEGEQRKDLENLIDKYHLDEDFILLGNQTNPFAYLNDCDLYVQPSRYEGYGITINEARILCKPIITTDFSGAREQLEDGITGWVVKIDEHSIYDAISFCLDNKTAIESIKSALKQHIKNESTNCHNLEYFYS